VSPASQEEATSSCSAPNDGRRRRPVQVRCDVSKQHWRTRRRSCRCPVGRKSRWNGGGRDRGNAQTLSPCFFFKQFGNVSYTSHENMMTLFSRTEKTGCRQIQNSSGYMSKMTQDDHVTPETRNWVHMQHGLFVLRAGMPPISELIIRDSIVASIPACHAGDRGSIPRLGDVTFLCLFCHTFLVGQ
jgi:hypothetical protein